MSDIVDELISLDIDTIVHMVEPIAHRDKGLLQEAKAAITQCDLHLWVCEQNIQKELALTVGALLRQRHRLSEKVGESNSDEPIAASKGRWACYKWISRWRKNWKLPKGKIQDRDALIPSEMTEKVRVALFRSKHKTQQLLATSECRQRIPCTCSGPNLDPENGPPWFQFLEKRGVSKSGPVLGGTLTRAIQSWGPKTTPFFEKETVSQTMSCCWEIVNLRRPPLLGNGTIGQWTKCQMAKGHCD